MGKLDEKLVKYEKGYQDRSLFGVREHLPRIIWDTYLLPRAEIKFDHTTSEDEKTA
jgi:hypothetical protein